MNKLILCFLISILNTETIPAAMQYTGSDTLISRDSLGKNNGTFRSSDTETEIIFDESKLSPQNVRIVFNELFSQYLTIMDALVYNDSFGAVRNTLKLLDDMKSKTKDFEILNKDVRWLLFINNFDNIRSKAESTNFISEQRFLFNAITNGIYEFIKQFGLHDKTIYLMQCTTETQIGNGKWFSGSRDKKNPYLGMINDTLCAKVKEVWKF